VVPASTPGSSSCPASKNWVGFRSLCQYLNVREAADCEEVLLCMRIAGSSFWCFRGVYMSADLRGRGSIQPLANT